MPETGYAAWRIPGNPASICRGQVITDDGDSPGFVVNPFDSSDQAPVVFTHLQNCSWQDVYLPKNIHNIFREVNHEENQEERKETYLNLCNLFIEACQKGNYEKLVFSRFEIATGIFDIQRIFETLCLNYPNAYIFFFASAITGTWMGASPELLLEHNHATLTTMSLAGTRKKNSDGDWGGKEIKEQKYVTDFITSVLEQSGCHEVQINGPVTHSAGPVEHLLTRISAQMKQNQPDFAHILLKTLHPTPAVCGIPRNTAMDFIMIHEGYKRMYYAGYSGIRQKTSGTYWVNIRCMQIFETFAHIYTGGGITAESIAELEWQEVIMKAETLKKVLSITN
jgi:isochorismate synthase